MSYFLKYSSFASLFTPNFFYIFVFLYSYDFYPFSLDYTSGDFSSVWDSYLEGSSCYLWEFIDLFSLFRFATDHLPFPVNWSVWKTLPASAAVLKLACSAFQWIHTLWSLVLRSVKLHFASLASSHKMLIRRSCKLMVCSYLLVF